MRGFSVVVLSLSLTVMISMTVMTWKGSAMAKKTPIDRCPWLDRPVVPVQSVAAQEFEQECRQLVADGYYMQACSVSPESTDLMPQWYAVFVHTQTLPKALR